MLDNLNTKISKVKEDLRRKQKLEGLLEKSKQELRSQEMKQNELYVILQKEEKDVKKLESLSLTGLFYSILGSKEEQMDKERQEYLAAKLKYDECCNTIKDLTEEISGYQKELKKYSDIDIEYQSLMKEKEELILSSHDDRAHRFLEMTERISNLQADAKEVKEAIRAGDNAMAALEQVIDSLESASGWGTWDLLGGGFIATAAKHSNIDKAKQYAHHAQRMLSVFNRELSDVNLSTDIHIEIGSFATFADYFFDGLISDWIVQSRIHDSIDDVKKSYYKVDRILKQLRLGLTDINKELEATKEEMRLFIEGA